MEQTKVRIQKEIFNGLEAVRLSGKTNMLDVPRVVKLALVMGHIDTAFWVYENRKAYVIGVFKGFESQEGGIARCAD
ncbi:MAG: DUF5049 domain-containing protein [Armatimonadota bacterium]